MVAGIMAESMQICPAFAIRTKTTRTHIFYAFHTRIDVVYVLCISRFPTFTLAKFFH